MRRHGPPDRFAMEGLKALQRTVARVLGRKRQLGQYAVFWRDSQVVFEGPDAPEQQPIPKPGTMQQQQLPLEDTHR